MHGAAPDFGNLLGQRDESNDNHAHDEDPAEVGLGRKVAVCRGVGREKCGTHADGGGKGQGAGTQKERCTAATYIRRWRR